MNLISKTLAMLVLIVSVTSMEGMAAFRSMASRVKSAWNTARFSPKPRTSIAPKTYSRMPRTFSRLAKAGTVATTAVALGYVSEDTNTADDWSVEPKQVESERDREQRLLDRDICKHINAKKKLLKRQEAFYPSNVTVDAVGAAIATPTSPENNKKTSLPKLPVIKAGLAEKLSLVTEEEKRIIINKIWNEQISQDDLIKEVEEGYNKSDSFALVASITMVCPPLIIFTWPAFIGGNDNAVKEILKAAATTPNNLQKGSKTKNA